MSWIIVLGLQFIEENIHVKDNTHVQQKIEQQIWTVLKLY